MDYGFDIEYLRGLNNAMALSNLRYDLMNIARECFRECGNDGYTLFLIQAHASFNPDMGIAERTFIEYYFFFDIQWKIEHAKSVWDIA